MNEEWSESKQPVHIEGTMFETVECLLTCSCLNEIYFDIETEQKWEGDEEQTCSRCGKRYRVQIKVLEAPALPDWKPPLRPPQEPLSIYQGYSD